MTEPYTVSACIGRRRDPGRIIKSMVWAFGRSRPRKEDEQFINTETEPIQQVGGVRPF